MYHKHFDDTIASLFGHWSRETYSIPYKATKRVTCHFNKTPAANQNIITNRVAKWILSKIISLFFTYTIIWQAQAKIVDKSVVATNIIPMLLIRQELICALKFNSFKWCIYLSCILGIIRCADKLCINWQSALYIFIVLWGKDNFWNTNVQATYAEACFIVFLPAIQLRG